MIGRRGLLTGAGLTAIGSGFFVRRVTAREAEFEAAFPPEGDILYVDDTPVHAVIRGTGPDLVMLHGASGNNREFTFDLIGRLQDRYRCIAFDRPGLGYTGRADPAYDAAFSDQAETPAEQADLLARAYAQIAQGDAPIVLGHSFGGTVALAWALDHAARSLVILAAAAMRWPGGLGPLYAVNASAPGGALAIPVLTATVPETKLRQVSERIFRPDKMPDGYFEHIGAQLTLRRRSMRANARQVNSLKPHIIEMEARYPDLTLPIEWLHGDADTIVPADVHAHPFKALRPHTNLTILPGVGHMPHHAAPDAVLAAIDRANTA